jgi:hypothetical protein
LATARIAGADFDLTAGEVERAVRRLEPEPIREHVVVVGGRRYPPKQVLAELTGLDRADFTTHQARSVLRRLGFGVHRRGAASGGQTDPKGAGPRGGAEAAALAPFTGRWIAQEGIEVLYDAESPEAVVGWLRRHGRQATVWRVPAHPGEAGSSLSAVLPG